MSRYLLEAIVNLLKLTQDEKTILMVLARFARNDGTGGRPGIATIVEFSGMSRRQIFRTIKALVKRGLIISRRNQKGRERLANSYTLILPKLLAVGHYHRSDKCSVCTYATAKKVSGRHHEKVPVGSQEGAKQGGLDSASQTPQAVGTTKQVVEAGAAKVIWMEDRKKPDGWHNYEKPPVLKVPSLWLR